jgi:hypothetical protein
MPGKRSPDVIQVNLRLHKNLHKWLVREAERNDRSLNAEMVERLNNSFRRDNADKILADAKDCQDKAEKLLEQVRDWRLPTIADYLMGQTPPTRRTKK